MREILFRGKRFDNGEWLEGWYIPPIDFLWDGEPVHFESTISYKVKDVRLKDEEVDPTTIGQYTGLTDKNGVKIFEGDIVRVLGNQDVDDWKNVNYTALIAYLDGGFCAIDGTVEDHEFRRYTLCRMDFELEVIGNIHDNPELLKGGEGECAM